MSESNANYAYMSLDEYLAQHSGKPIRLAKSSKAAKDEEEKTDWEAMLLAQIQAHDLPAPTLQYRVSAAIVGKGRGIRERIAAADLQDWRFDMAYVAHKLAVEVDGGTWMEGGGGHNTGSGYERDRNRDGKLMTLGWRTLRVTPRHIENGRAVEWIASLLSKRPCADVLAELIATHGEHATLGEVARATQ